MVLYPGMSVFQIFMEFHFFVNSEKFLYFCAYMYIVYIYAQEEL